MYRMIIRKRLWNWEFIAREDGMDRYTLVTLLIMNKCGSAKPKKEGTYFTTKENNVYSTSLPT